MTADGAPLPSITLKVPVSYFLVNSGSVGQKAAWIILVCKGGSEYGRGSWVAAGLQRVNWCRTSSPGSSIVPLKKVHIEMVTPIGIYGSFKKIPLSMLMMNKSYGNLVIGDVPTTFLEWCLISYIAPFSGMHMHTCTNLYMYLTIYNTYTK